MRDSFLTHILDLFEPTGPSHARAMMGGQLIFCCELPVGLIFEERLYLKVDSQTKESFAKAYGEPFVYEHEGRRVEMSFWTPPDATLEDREEMKPWALLALEAAARSKKPHRRRRR